MTTEHIYMDHAASTPVDPMVVEAMLPYFTQDYGNPSSVHAFGRNAEDAIEAARRDIAQVLNCQPNEVVFTSCATESNNLALRGTAWAAQRADKPVHVITTPVEHPAVGKTAEQLRDLIGAEVTILPVDDYGRVDPADVRAALRPHTTLVSVMFANNEVGTLQPIAEIAGITRKAGVLFHTDAVQAAGQHSLDVEALGVDMLALSAHKFYGPKGVGILYVRKGVELLPSQSGGSHERGRRGGTSNTPYIVGMAKALQMADEQRETDTAHYLALRKRLVDGVLATIDDAQLTGHPEHRLPNNASFAFKDVDGNNLLMHLDMAGIAASSGSACKTGDPEPSDVLMALGFEREWALGGLRLTLGRQSTEAHVERVLAVLPEKVTKVRDLGQKMAAA
jgi:cysteine desulfurase